MSSGPAQRGEGPSAGGHSRALPLYEEHLSRRRFVQTLSAIAAAAGLDACWRPPREPILPYVHQPPELVPGVPVSYATAFVLDGYATGLLVQTREGRPIKVEGNPIHPASLGATGVFEQAWLLDLYDARRLRQISRSAQPATWDDIVTDFVAPAAAGRGEGLAFLLEPTSSELRSRLLDQIRNRLPAARIYFHAAIGPSPALEAYSRAAGRPLVPRYDFSRARIIAAFDADFATSMPFHLRYARDFAARRAVPWPTDASMMNRLYVAEPVPSAVAPVADHLLRIRAGDIVFLLRDLVTALGGTADGLAATPTRLSGERVQAWMHALAADLRAHPGEGVVVVGETQPAAAHALAHEANRLVRAFGGPMVLQQPALTGAGDIGGGLARLTQALETGEIDRVVILEGDPAGTAPADVAFAHALASVNQSLYLGRLRNATAARCGWTVPGVHLLETWSDARAFDGTLTPVQPVTRPLVRSARSPDALLQAFAGERDRTVYDRLRHQWRGSLELGPPGDEAWELWWQETLSRGVVDGTSYAPVHLGPIDPAPLLLDIVPPDEAVEIAFRPDPRLHDGRFATNAWLQELPHPLTKVTWGNALLLSPGLAAELGVERGDVVRVELDGRRIRAPAFPTPGHAERAVTLTLGHVRPAPGTGPAPRAVNAYEIRTLRNPWFAAVTLTPLSGETWPLAVSQPEQHLHDRPLIPRRTLAEYLEHPEFTLDQRRPEPELYVSPQVGRADHQWGMTIDLSICTGCSACVVACRAENNIPIVGPEDVGKGRIMDWLRIDAYVVGPDDEPEEHLRQPLLCQHCEDAPCEYVCPVYATVHSPDGLNEMIYNRCVGTRFCSNNCPYKVRRFNWFDYNRRRTPEENLVLNPDVTVRARGIMEKCTYCVQRIRRTENQARAAGRALAPGEVLTACQQVCPTRAIVFGDLTQPDSAIVKRRADPRRYELLHELGTRPRTQYLARISNPHPELDARARAGSRAGS